MIITAAAGTLPNINTLVASIAVAMGFASAVIGLVIQRRAGRTAAKVEEISVNVNGRLTELFDRQAQLLGALHEAGVPVPPRTPPSAPPAAPQAPPGPGTP